MYITYKETKYPCVVSVGAAMRYAGLPEDFPAPVNAEIVLYDDEGFEMRRDNPAGFLRQTFGDGVLVLTNTPEPQPVEPGEPVPTLDERMTAVEEGQAELTEALEMILNGVTE